MTTRRALLGALSAIALAAASLLPGGVAAAEEKGPLVFAAASLKNALDAVNAAWTRETGKTARVSYAASSALAKQIESGAPADLFVSADLDWMNELAGKSLIQPASRVELLGNSIVLVAPKGTAKPAEIAAGFPLKDLLGSGRLAMANVDSVPAGKYGKAALTQLGLWDGVEDQVAQAENVRAALLLVSRAEAPLGIVYKTDAAADPAVEVIGTFPKDSHPPIVYPAALTADATNPDAGAFLDFLKTDQAKALFEAQGFTVLSKD